MPRGAGAGRPRSRGARPSSAGRRRAEGLGAARRHCPVRLDRQAVLRAAPGGRPHGKRRAVSRAERHALGVDVHCVPAAPHGLRPADPRTTARALPTLARGARGAGTGHAHLHPGALNAGMPPAAASVQSCAARLLSAAADFRFGVPREIVPGTAPRVACRHYPSPRHGEWILPNALPTCYIGPVAVEICERSKARRDGGECRGRDRSRPAVNPGRVTGRRASAKAPPWGKRGGDADTPRQAGRCGARGDWEGRKARSKDGNGQATVAGRRTGARDGQVGRG